MKENPTPVQAKAESASAFDAQEVQTSAAPPAFQLKAGAGTPIQRQVPDGGESGTAKTITDQLKELYAAEDKTAFWKYIHDNRAKIKADTEASAWIDKNLSTIGNWRADTIVSDGDYKKWTQAHIRDLITKVRAQFPPVADIRTFLENPMVTNDYKLQFLGEMMAKLGQIEYILGTMFHKGGSWENKGSNAGDIVNEYHTSTGFTWDNDEWCTMFAGHLHLLVGFRENLIKKKGVMWSNPRLRSWHQDNKNYTKANDDIETPSDYKNYSGLQISRTDWQALKSSLVTHYAAKHADDAAKATALKAAMDTWFTGKMVPQPGDMIILNNSKTASNPENHTAMVEAYNASTWTISTVEGNSDNKVRGRQIKLSEDPTNGSSTNAASMSMLLRPGLEFYKATPNADGEAGQDTAAHALQGMPMGMGAMYSVIYRLPGIVMLGKVDALTTELRGMAQAEGAVGTGTTVAEMSNPTNTSGSTN